MIEKNERIQLAKMLSKEKRKKILMSFKEAELRQYLKELFESMEPDYTTEITHGPDEFGKDLVIVKRDKIGTDVIGVVVKTGDIRAKTSGDVDKVKTHVKKIFSSATETKIKNIKSQVQQALEHPAEMKTIFKELPISKVFIVLAGGMSKQARTRIEKELIGKIEIKDIDWLINNFTNYYPQIFFEGRVIDFLEEKIKQLEKKHWLSKKGKNLSDYFVEPRVAIMDVPLGLNEENFALIIEKRRMPFSKLKSILTQTKQIILVGDPGVGKSGALAKIAIDMLRELSDHMLKGMSKKEKIKIPVLVSAKEILEADNYEQLLEKYFVTLDIKDRFKVKVLMIDALDEILPSQSREVIEKAKEFSQKLACSLIITSRKVETIKTPPIGFKKYELLPFEYGQALEVFEKLASSNKVLSSLKDGLKRIKNKIPMIPLSLLLLIELVEDKKEIPASVTELYERFQDLMLGRWDKEKGIEVLFEYFIKGNFLAKLAFKEFLEKDRLEISQNDWEEFLNNYASLYGWDEEGLSFFIKEIKRAGILNIKETVVFRHRSFLDFFAARYIFDKRAEFKNLNDFIVKTYFNDVWGDVAFFYVGLGREISDSILEKIFAFEEESISIYIDKFLTGVLLQAGWNSPTKRKYYGIEKAVTFASVVRDEFLKVAEKRGVKVPGIFADFLVMALSDLGFGSLFLSKEVKFLFNELLIQLSQQSLYSILSLLPAIKRSLSPDELREAIDKSSEIISKIPGLSVEEKAGSLLFLLIIGRKDKDIARPIRRKLNRLKRRYPDTFRKLLPFRKKGFR